MQLVWVCILHIRENTLLNCANSFSNVFFLLLRKIHINPPFVSQQGLHRATILSYIFSFVKLFCEHLFRFVSLCVIKTDLLRDKKCFAKAFPSDRRKPIYHNNINSGCISHPLFILIKIEELFKLHLKDATLTLLCNISRAKHISNFHRKYITFRRQHITSDSQSPIHFNLHSAISIETAVDRKNNAGDKACSILG